MTRPLVPRLPKPWRPRPILPLLALAVVALGIATSAGAGLRTSGRAGTVRIGTVRVAAASHAVQIADFAFAPQAITVTVGDSITWTNQDEAPHTVTTSSGPQAISSPSLSKGQSFTFTFTAPGTYSYYCAVHPDMRAEVVVNPAPAAPSTSAPVAKPSSTAARPPTRSATAPAPATTQPAAPSSPVRSESDAPTAAPSMSMPSSASSASAKASSSAAVAAPSSSAATPPTSSTSSAATTDAAPPPASAAAASDQNPLNPALVLAGLTAGATVFCLLLVASRRPDGGENGP